MADMERIAFGPADITVGTDTDVVKFDGKDQLQADGASLTITPILEDITTIDTGNGPYDQRVVGYEISVTIVAAFENIKTLELALSSATTITDTVSNAVVGLTDSPIGTSMRKRAKQVRIHPRGETTEEFDAVIYKMASTGEYTRNYNLEQNQLEITFTAYPRDNMDASKEGNFFYIGGVDPNAAA